jgi:hypothetical protein
MITDLKRDSDDAIMRDCIIKVLGKLKGLETYFESLPDGDISKNVCGDLAADAYIDAYVAYKILRDRLK